MQKFNWQDAVKIVLALVATGFVWTVDNQMAMLALAAMIIVWGVKFYALRTGKTIGKFGLTMTLLGISVGFAVLFNPVAIPPMPVFPPEDAAGAVNVIFAWLGAWLLLGKEVFAIATALYNILLADVLKKLEPVPAEPVLLKSTRK